VKKPVLILAALGFALGGGLVFALSEAERFPHETHFGLFPTCLGCHEGIPTGDEAAYYSVELSDCQRCHDGDRAGRIEWEGPTRTASNLDFTHTIHDEDMACGECHQLPGTTEMMEVGRAAPGTCLDCHGDLPEDHLDPSIVYCDECHKPLTEATELPAGRIAMFPAPASHEEEGFLSEHGAQASRGGAIDDVCAVCHAQESCTRCHLNADRVETIQALAPDPRVASLVAGKTGEWPLPASHEASDWGMGHAAGALDDIESCANCHAAPSCEGCHGSVTNLVAGDLPWPAPGGPMGAAIVPTTIPGHTSNFATEHGAAAGADIPSSSSCHADNECAASHAARTPESQDPTWVWAGVFEADTPDNGADALNKVASAAHDDPDEPRPGYHPVNFVLRHGAEAFAAQTVCTDCHTTEIFCRECHAQSGAGVSGFAKGNAFHDAQPDWLLAHGQAARLGMEECASCHEQNSCLRCHSAKSGWRINPHGPGFDPGRVADRSQMSCAICHYRDQINDP
jgi:hypothetical protein